MPAFTRQKRRLIEAVKAGRIAFRDINFEPEALAGYGASLEDVRRRLRATDAAGRLLVGADVADCRLAGDTGEGWLATLFGNPVALPLTRFAYDRFADLLYAWNRAQGPLVVGALPESPPRRADRKARIFSGPCRRGATWPRARTASRRCGAPPAAPAAACRETPPARTDPRR